MIEFLATVDSISDKAYEAWRPPPVLSLSEWADKFFYLSAESAAEPGRWHTLPYQKGPMDAVTDPTVRQITFMKSARVGYTKMINAAIGYYIHQAPASMIVVQPTVDDAKGYSKDEIAPMLRDVPVLTSLVLEDSDGTTLGAKDASNTMLYKKFPGGKLELVGANSGTGFRRRTAKVILFDEVDGYPPSAGSDGDQIELGIKRTSTFWDRKIVAGSTPLVAGSSRIEKLFEEGDQCRYYVPCSQCGHFDYLVFSERADRQGHFMQWPEGQPQDAHFVCSQNGCVIEAKDKRTIVAAGEWRASKPFTGHVSFHIWSAYGFSPDAAWGEIATKFVKAKGNIERLRTFVNVELGETWKERGDAPDWDRLHQRRQPRAPGVVPAGVRFLTAGVDVQKDRFVFEIVGWDEDRRSWSIDQGVIAADTANEAEWMKLDQILSRQFASDDGQIRGIVQLAVDSGYNTQQVYNWARRHVGRVLATKGMRTAKTVLGQPTPVDVTLNGRRIARGCKVWPVGVDVIKAELYGWLKLPMPAPGEPVPSGYCEFPEYDPEYFKQLTAEHLVSSVDRRGFTINEWQVIPGRENHVLDCRVYARAAANAVGLDRIARQPVGANPVSQTTIAPPRARVPRSDSNFIGDRAKGWFDR